MSGCAAPGQSEAAWRLEAAAEEEECTTARLERHHPSLMSLRPALASESGPCCCRRTHQMAPAVTAAAEPAPPAVPTPPASHAGVESRSSRCRKSCSASRAHDCASRH